MRLWPPESVPAQILHIFIPGTTGSMCRFLQSSEKDRGKDEAGKGGRRSVAQTHKQVWGPVGSLALA